MTGRIINISGVKPVEDPSYPYKMPSVIGRIKQRGHGFKTVIVNISNLASSLNRHPSEVNQFFGYEMGATTTYDRENDRAVVIGAHSDLELQDCVHKYIEKFVLCPSCRSPKTTYNISEGCIWYHCAACKRANEDMVDRNHKLCIYILTKHKKTNKRREKQGSEEDIINVSMDDLSVGPDSSVDDEGARGEP